MFLDIRKVAYGFSVCWLAIFIHVHWLSRIIISSESQRLHLKGFLGKLRHGAGQKQCVPGLMSPTSHWVANYLYFHSPNSQITAEKQRSWI